MQRFEQVPQVFSRMRNIQKPDGIAAMDFHTVVQPICSIHHGTDLVGLNQLASARFHLSQIGKGSRIAQA
jgi:hypothetical protein